MDCTDARLHVLDLQQGRLTAAAAAEVHAHLAGCAECARAAAVEAALTETLERLPQHAASLALKRRLRDQWPVSAPGPAPARRWRAVVAGLAVAAVVVAAVPLTWERLVAAPDRGAGERLVGEAVNDHVRLLVAQEPLEVKSSDTHQVRPWFTGRLDFAPDVTFGGDAEFPLRGGAVGYFLDRKAAVLVYGHRLHVVSLLVFRVDGLRWPGRGLTPLGGVPTYASAARGFNTLLWRRGDLGYALVSDAEPASLRALAERLIAGS